MHKITLKLEENEMQNRKEINTSTKKNIYNSNHKSRKQSEAIYLRITQYGRDQLRGSIKKVVKED
jgi:hypothetical protein